MKTDTKADVIENSDATVPAKGVEAGVTAPAPTESAGPCCVVAYPKAIDLDQIVVDDATHPRDHVDAEVVKTYAEAMAAGIKFPEIYVYGSDCQYWLADGRHRLEAAKLSGQKSIRASVFPGTQRDAILHALGANSEHGLRRSSADKRKAVTIMLRDQEWGQWNDSEIARQCAVSQDLVAAVRTELSGSEPADARLVRRGGKEFLQNRRQGVAQAPAHIDAITDMCGLARSARATAPDTEMAQKLARVGNELHELLGKSTAASDRLVKNLREPVNVYIAKVGAALHKSPELKKQGLASHALSLGIGRCGNQCAYCQHQPQQKILGLEQFDMVSCERGAVAIDADASKGIGKCKAKANEKSTVLLPETGDAWAPEARKLGLGRKCLQALLKETAANIHIITKSADIVKDLDVAKGSEKRVVVGIAIPAPLSREDVAAAIEPNASSVSERLQALKQVKALGFTSYVITGPCLPGVADTESALTEMFGQVREHGVESVTLEPVSAKAQALQGTALALRIAGLHTEAQAVEALKEKTAWTAYAVTLAETAVAVATKLGMGTGLRIHLRRDAFTAEQCERLDRLGTAITWQGKDTTKSGTAPKAAA